MIAECQKNILDELKTLAESRPHSVFISGPAGCGKTYLASQYANFLGISQIYNVNPVVCDIRDTIQNSTDVNQDIVLCVENLDLGNKAASYSLLKFLEEPSKYIYIVVTCRNRYHIPGTILSRSISFECNPPTRSDIRRYLDSNNSKFSIDERLMNSISSFSDCDSLCSLSKDNMDYIVSCLNMNIKKYSVSDMVWNCSHYPSGISGDNNTLPYIIIRCILCETKSSEAKQICIDCLNGLSEKRIAANMVLSKFVFEMKYAIG